MPNPAVKLPIADGTAEGICGRVGRRRALLNLRVWNLFLTLIFFCAVILNRILYRVKQHTVTHILTGNIFREKFYIVFLYKCNTI